MLIMMVWNKKKLSVIYFSYKKNNLDKIFLYSDKTLNLKRIGTINEPPSIYLSFIFTVFANGPGDFKNGTWYLLA